MARQRNNVAKLPWEIRQIVCRLRFDCASNADIDAAVAAACAKAGITAPKIHAGSILAYERSSEYAQYCDHRRQWDERMAPKRWAAAMINEGKGPQSVADLAELEILEQLHSIAAGGILETGKDIATVARAITAMQRTHIARRAEEADQRIEALEAEHAAEIAELLATIAELNTEAARLREALAVAGIDPDAQAKPEAGLSAAALKQIEERAKLL